MTRRANPTVIGGFVLGGALLAVIAVVVFGSGQLFRDTQTFISFFDGSVSGLEKGASVRFRGIEVGSVKDILLDLPVAGRDSSDLRIAVVYDLDRKLLESRGATARLEDPLDINTLYRLGIRAELSTESLVTGRKYIALDLNPDRPISLEPVAGTPYPEIPTVNTGLERIQEEVFGIIADLGAVRLDSLVNVATAALGDMGKLAASPGLASSIERLPGTLDRLDATLGDLQALLVRVDSSLTPITDGVRESTAQATVTMQRLETTLDDVGVVLQGVGGVLEPESPFIIEFERAMNDLSGASRALRDLADYLERNPSALIRGRPGGDQ